MLSCFQIKPRYTSTLTHKSPIFIHSPHLLCLGHADYDQNFSETLLQHIEEYVSEELLEVLDRLAEVANVEELKQSVNIACELRESILTNCNRLDTEMSSESSDAGAQRQQAHLAHQLQSALTTLQVLTLDHAPALATSIGDQTLQRVTEAASQLFEELTAVVSATQVAVQQSDITNKTEHTIFKESDIVDRSTEEKEKSMVFEEAVTVQEDIALEEEANKSSDEPVAFLATQATIAEVESQLTENIAETIPKVFEQGISMESTDTISLLVEKSKVEESTRIGAVDSVLIDSETAVEQQTVNESKSEFIVDEKIVEFAVIVNTEDIPVKDVREDTDQLATNESVKKHDDEVKDTAIINKEIERSAPISGKYVLSHCITLI